MTSPAFWNPNVLDDASNTLHGQLWQFSSTSIELTDCFYNMEGDMIVQKTNFDDNSVTSNNSSTSSDSRRRSYRQLTRRERGRKRHKLRISWWDQPVTTAAVVPIFSSYPDVIQSSGPVDMFEPRIRGESLMKWNLKSKH